MNRRDFLAGAGAVGAIAALPVPVMAAASSEPWFRMIGLCQDLTTIQWCVKIERLINGERRVFYCDISEDHAKHLFPELNIWDERSL